ncbi:hypothetical protein Ocin01_17312 [Orchesella cincta]|uniref:Uncharacterized protein n=1 Tax=Orchesella cincta TaxID=48709 RepID=A0A1D2M8V3_ORCCI|nr:hypothetical protein Ocin01_17312 [Orchesella cincta]
MRCMPLMILQNFDEYAIPDLLEQKETEQESMAKDLLSYIDAWVYIREKIDEFLHAAEQSKKCYFKEKTIKLLPLGLHALEDEKGSTCTICFPTQRGTQPSKWSLLPNVPALTDLNRMIL